MMQSNFILLHPDDNVLVCRSPGRADETILINEEKIVLLQEMELGHKVAGRTISKGEKIVKYGVNIGSALQDISAGEHVHLHNMKSDYHPPHDRERLYEISDYK